jgi:hypothetical protein
MTSNLLGIGLKALTDQSRQGLVLATLNSSTIPSLCSPNNQLPSYLPKTNFIKPSWNTVKAMLKELESSI